jgi:monoamine oxidase
LRRPRLFGKLKRSGKKSETMIRVSRRSFLAAAAAAVAAPALRAAAQGDTDIAVVGAGAAGIAAARRIVAAGRSVIVLEAAGSLGGRCVTDTGHFGLPYDRGAHWLHTPDLNPLAKLAGGVGLDIYSAPPGQKFRIGRRNAREGEIEDFLAGLVRANRTIREAGRGKTDASCAQVLPKDLGDWRPAIEFVLGPYGCSKELAEVSAADFARASERDIGAFCRQGLGTLLAKLGAGLPVRLSAPVTRIASAGGGRIEIETARGKVLARAVIVTASTNVLAGGTIGFAPELPKRQLEALSRLTLGSYDHIALELPGNPLGLQRDDLVFEKSQGRRTAAMLANIGGTSLCVVDVAGHFGRDLSAQGERAMIDFGIEWLTGLYGTDIRSEVRRAHATRWNSEPFVLGAASSAPPGWQPARKVLMEPVRDRIFFAGEAVHETLWGTVGGAWESGERAANAALRLFGIGIPGRAPPPPQRPARPPQPQQRRQ